jgi:hypothetical protein
LFLLEIERVEKPFFFIGLSVFSLILRGHTLFLFYDRFCWLLNGFEIVAFLIGFLLAFFSGGEY